MSGALSGLTVIDFTRVLSGPYCTMTLSDLGARVIKIEHPVHGDDTRHWGPPWHEHGDERVAAYFLAAKRGKRSVAIDFATEEGAGNLIKGGGIAEAKKALAESGYDGTPIVIMAPGDVVTLKAQPIVSAQLLRDAGFKVDLQATDWQTVVARRASLATPGWRSLSEIRAIGVP